MEYGYANVYYNSGVVSNGEHRSSYTPQVSAINNDNFPLRANYQSLFGLKIVMRITICYLMQYVNKRFTFKPTAVEATNANTLTRFLKMVLKLVMIMK